MYKNELINLISQKRVPKSLFFYGECSYQSDYYLGQILNILGGCDKLSLYFDEFDFNLALTHILQNSLFGGFNVLLVKFEKKIPPNELKRLIDVADRVENSYFFLQFSGEIKTAKSLDKYFSKKSHSGFIRFFKPKLYEAVNFIKKEASKVKLEIDNYAIEYLFMTNNKELNLAVHELKKLSIFGKNITYNEIDKFSSAKGKSRLEEFIQLLLKKKNITNYLQNILEFYSEVDIINEIENYITTLFMFSSYIQIHGQFNSIAVLGYNLPPQIINQRIAEANKINFYQYQTILEHLLNSELKLKNSRTLQKTSYLFHSLIKLQTLF